MNTELSDKTKYEGLIRHSYMGIVWTHKIQEKQADIYLRRKNTFEVVRIVSSSLTAAGLISIVFAYDELWIKLLTALVSFVTLVMEALSKSYDFDFLIASHRNVASALMELRDSYQHLIYKAQESETTIANLDSEYQKLEKKKHSIYKEAPRTTDRAVEMARVALHVNKDNVFLDGDIDAALPACLRR